MRTLCELQTNNHQRAEWIENIERLSVTMEKEKSQLKPMHIATLEDFTNEYKGWLMATFAILTPMFLIQKKGEAEHLLSVDSIFQVLSYYLGVALIFVMLLTFILRRFQMNNVQSCYISKKLMSDWPREILKWFKMRSYPTIGNNILTRELFPTIVRMEMTIRRLSKGKKVVIASLISILLFLIVIFTM